MSGGVQVGSVGEDARGLGLDEARLGTREARDALGMDVNRLGGWGRL